MSGPRLPSSATGSTSPPRFAVKQNTYTGLQNSYLMRLLIELDIFANVLTGGNLGETISARVGRDRHHHGIERFPAELGANVLNAIQPGHTNGAVLHDLERAEYIEQVEKDAKAKRET